MKRDEASLGCFLERTALLLWLWLVDLGKSFYYSCRWSIPEPEDGSGRIPCNFSFGNIYRNMDPIKYKLYYERTQGFLLMLLSSPLTVGEIFLGKCLAIFLVAYLVQLVALAISTWVIWSTFAVLPPPSLLPMLFITIPIYGFIFMELLGLAYALLRNISYLVLIIIVIVPFLGTLHQIMSFLNLFISNPIISIGSGILLALFLLFITNKISKEGMVMVLSWDFPLHGNFFSLSSWV